MIVVTNSVESLNKAYSLSEKLKEQLPRTLSIITEREDEPEDEFIQRLMRVNSHFDYTVVMNGDNIKHYLREIKEGVVTYLLDAKYFSELEEWNLFKRSFPKPEPILMVDLEEMAYAGI